MSDACVRLERDLAGRGRAGNLQPLRAGYAVRGGRAERGALGESVERCREEARRPCVRGEEDPRAGVARGVLRVRGGNAWYEIRSSEYFLGDEGVEELGGKLRVAKDRS